MVKVYAHYQLKKLLFIFCSSLLIVYHVTMATAYII